MGTHENPWELMGTHRDPWEPMGTYGALRRASPAASPLCGEPCGDPWARRPLGLGPRVYFGTLGWSNMDSSRNPGAKNLMFLISDGLNETSFFVQNFIFSICVHGQRPGNAKFSVCPLGCALDTENSPRGRWSAPRKPKIHPGAPGFIKNTPGAWGIMKN